MSDNTDMPYDNRNEHKFKSRFTDGIVKNTLASLFNSLCSEIHAVNIEKGFWEEGTFNLGEKVALIHAELSELLEANRKENDAMSEKIPEFTKEEEELADVFIRGMDLARFMNYNLIEAIFAKLQYNITRPYKHNRKY